MSATAGSYRHRRHSRTASPWSTWSHRRQSLNSELNSYSGGGGVAMPTYVLLFNWTEQGVRNAKDTTKRADKFRVQAEEFRVKVRETLWTMGPYDALALVDAPDDAAASRLAVWMGSQGNVRSLTMRCYTAAEMEKVVEGIG